MEVPDVFNVGSFGPVTLVQIFLASALSIDGSNWLNSQCGGKGTTYKRVGQIWVG